MRSSKWFSVTTAFRFGAILGVAVLALVGGRLVQADLVSKISANPEVGMTDAQRTQFHNQQRQLFVARYETWLQKLDISKVDFASLPRQTIQSDSVPPQPSLAEALSHSDHVIHAKVVSLKPTPFGGTLTTVSVRKSLKGTTASTLVITQAGGLRPTQDWKGIVLAEGPNAPFLIPGDEALLFLFRDSRGELEVQSFSGEYRVRNGLVEAPFSSIVPFSARFNGKPVSDVTASLEEAISATQPPS